MTDFRRNAECIAAAISAPAIIMLGIAAFSDYPLSVLLPQSAAVSAVLILAICANEQHANGHAKRSNCLLGAAVLVCAFICLLSVGYCCVILDNSTVNQKLPGHVGTVVVMMLVSAFLFCTGIYFICCTRKNKADKKVIFAALCAALIFTGAAQIILMIAQTKYLPYCSLSMAAVAFLAVSALFGTRHYPEKVIVGFDVASVNINAALKDNASEDDESGDSDDAIDGGKFVAFAASDESGNGESPQTGEGGLDDEQEALEVLTYNSIQQWLGIAMMSFAAVICAVSEAAVASYIRFLLIWIGICGLTCAGIGFAMQSQTLSGSVLSGKELKQPKDFRTVLFSVCLGLAIFIAVAGAAVIAYAAVSPLY